LIVLGDFNLPDISWSPSTDLLVSTPLSVHDFVGGLLELSLKQVSFIRNSLHRQLDLVFVLDPSEITVSRIDPLVVPDDRYHPTLELKICLPCVDTHRLSNIRYSAKESARGMDIFLLVASAT